MVVQEELRIATAEDIPVYAAGRRVWRTTREIVMASHCTGSTIAPDVSRCADMVTTLIAMALRAPDAETELLRWRQAELMLDVLRADSYSMLVEKSCANEMFDALHREITICEKEIRCAIRNAKSRAWARLQGVPSERPLFRAALEGGTRVRRRTMTLPAVKP
jgi:hypothetical protein